MSGAYPSALRDLAAWYETHPDIPTPQDPLRVFSFQSKEEAARVVHAFGSCRKQYVDGLLYVERDFGAGVVLSFVFSREEVCVRKVVGTRAVPEEVIPAHEEEIVEWECEPVLAAPLPTEDEADFSGSVRVVAGE